MNKLEKLAIGTVGLFTAFSAGEGYIAYQPRQEETLDHAAVIVDDVVVHNGLNGQSPYAELFFRKEGTKSGYHALVPQRSLRDNAYNFFTKDKAQGAESRMAISGNVDDLCVHGYDRARDVEVTGLEDIE